MPAQGFTRIAEVETEAPAAPQKQTNAALQMLLAALSEKVGAFAAALFALITVGSAWWLWLKMPDDPTPTQLDGLGMYALFILALHGIRRNRK